jgi:alkylated DNA nucleotide flippase Atl1
MKKRTWFEKLTDTKGLPKIVELDGKAAQRWGGNSMVVPLPMDIYNLMSQVPSGKVTTVNEIRKALAKKYNTDIACPLTTGIFACISAWASTESTGNKAIKPIPYWRTLKSNFQLNEKFPGGVENQAEKLKSEGIEVIQKGNKFKVAPSESQFFSSENFQIF